HLLRVRRRLRLGAARRGRLLRRRRRCGRRRLLAPPLREKRKRNEKDGKKHGFQSHSGAHSNHRSPRASGVAMKTLAFCAAMLLSTAYAQETFDPFPNGGAPYPPAFSRIFASPDAETSDRAALVRELDAFQAMRGHVTSDAKHLLAALQRNDAIQARVARHAMYLYLRYAVDTRDEKSRDDDDAIEAEAAAKTAFVKDR